MPKCYTETYLNLYHGTTVEAASSIIKTNKFIYSNGGNWCGEGVYFYDNKSKAMWAANRKCNEIKNTEGKKCKPTYVTADIIELPKKFVLDLRSHTDVVQFGHFVNEILAEGSFDIEEDITEKDKLIVIRAALLSLFAKEKKKKLIIGNFKQNYQPALDNAFLIANDWQLVIGVETIYCVKDSCILTNIGGICNV